MMDATRMVKVDNWSVFFLQKLQALYTRGEYCDLTLQFQTNECIRVHRLVLNTCTEYFEALIKANNVTNNHMRLPPTLQSDVVVPIINFMYTGRLEFRPELHVRLHKTAKILNMQILSKLLDTQAGPLCGKNSYPLTTSTAMRKVSIVPSLSAPSSSSNLRASEHSDILPGKRLPIWKKRTSSSSFSVNVTPKTVLEEPAKPTRFEWPEDDDSQSAPLLYSSTFDDISYDSVPIVKSINNIVQSTMPSSPSQPLVQLSQERVMPAATFESVYQSANLKRGATSSTVDPSNQESSSSKKAKVDIDDVKELMQEQEVRKGLIVKSDDESEHETEDIDDFLPEADIDDDEEDVDDPASLASLPSQHFKTTLPQTRSTPKPILKVHDSPDASKDGSITPSKKVRFSLETKVHAPSPVESAGPSTSGVAPITSSVNAVASTSAATAPSTISGIPAGAQQSSATAVVATSSPPDGTSSSSQKAVVTDSSGSPLGVRATTISVTKSSDGTTVTQKVPNVNNHAKIIAEVLKKYPDLVKNNKNIRLKIMQKDGSPTVSVERPGGSGDNKPKVSYMVVKADQAVKAKVQLEQSSQQSGAHNTTGPWLCAKCGEPNKPLNFDTYYLYRKHLQEVHQEKIDVRICEHCGHRASKRNLLLYHLYTKHNIPPPRNCQFPKCDQCDHIALSEALLVKHKNVHGNSKEFSCRLCNSVFKNYGALQTHMQTNLHCDQSKKSHDCPICHKKFNRQFTLKTHIRSDHKEAVGKLLDDGVSELNSSPGEQTELQEDQSLQQGHVVHAQAIQSDTQQQTTFILPPGVTLVAENPNTLMQSTEAEALSNVASGIAASLGVAETMVVGDQGQHQTLILVDKNQLIHLPGGSSGTQVHEYIVPEIMAGDMGQGVGVYTSTQLPQLVQYTTSGGLQQPVAVSTSDQGLMTITSVSANGSIVNHTVPQQTAQVLQQPLVSIAQGQMSDHNAGEIAMILTDHPYSEGIVRENGAVIQTSSVPVTMSMVSSSSVVSVLPAVVSESSSITSSVQCSRTNSDMPQLMPVVEEQNKVVGEIIDSSNPPNLEPHEEQAPAPQTQKMAELVSDWDDVDEDGGDVDQKAGEQEAEDAAMPSRPTILLKTELDQDGISENLVKIT